ncbi:hypothetical protein [Celeribacter litoreus]|uniref:hypothetical protein n=1 Tax=Celeribacter litoreus TaxID=2876714 RepID=UPI001CCBD833|nr:hypothetical protein [Celeribacter litoreus]MCA0045054.1 hypothetical protein [Celeribacter litoreus]
MLDTTAMSQSISRVFCVGRLSVGLITPLEAYPESPFPMLNDHQQIAKQAEDAGFGSFCVRDMRF